MTLADHLARKLWNSLVICRQQRRRCLKEDSADAVHDLRIAIRRVLETLRVFEQILDLPRVKSLRASLRSWMRLSGAIRDLDIATELIGRSQGEGCGELLAAIARKRSRQASRAATQLRQSIPWPAKSELRQWLPSSRRNIHEKLWDLELTARQNAALVLPLLLERYCLSGDRLVASKAPRKAFHRFRLRTKRIRYATEWFVDLYGATGVPELAATLKDFQQSLGALQDCTATGRLLEKRSFARHLDDPLRELLEQFLHREAAQAQLRFETRWALFREKDSFARWLACFPPASNYKS